MGLSLELLELTLFETSVSPKIGRFRKYSIRKEEDEFFLEIKIDEYSLFQGRSVGEHPDPLFYGYGI